MKFPNYRKDIADAKQRTRSIIAVAVENGKYQVQQIKIQRDGSSDVIPLSSWMPEKYVSLFLRRL